MKGILIKDLFTIRRTAMIYLAFMTMFVFYSSSGVLIIAMMYASTLSMSLVALEERSRYERLSLMLPVLPVQHVFSKYLITWMAMGIVAAVSIASSLAHGTAIFDVVPACAVALIVNTLTMPLIFAFGVEKGRLIYSLGIVGQMIVLSTVLDLSFAGETMVNWLLLLAVAVLLSAGSILVSAKAYAARVTA